jgi:glucuronoarabinoxylan endo-1,4-beta-xylanase
MRLRLLALLLVLLGVPASAQTLTVNFGTVAQTIDGFGASNRDDPAPLTEAQADLFFSPTNGIGLSLLRTSIWTDGTDFCGCYSDATKAAARGAKVWAAPWTAAANQKTPQDLNNGAVLNVSAYDAWATTLAGAQANYQSNAGVNLYALSFQNEPDFTASYNSMRFTGAQAAAFMDVLGPKLAALSPVPKLMAPETADAPTNLSGFTTAIAGDSTAQGFLGIMAWHQYGGVSAPPTSFRPYWQTEMSGVNDAWDATITHALTVATWIHDAIATGVVSAWHYWMLVGVNADNEGLLGQSSNSLMTKRLWALGNYSKFVRPGFVVVGTTGTTSGVAFSAFKQPTTGALVLVCINTNGTPTAMTITLSGLSPTKVTPWVTSAALDLAQQADIAVSAGVFSATLAASSVTSFVGPPALAGWRR